MLVIACDRCGETKNVVQHSSEDICEACIQGDHFTFMNTWNPSPDQEWSEILEERHEDFMREF